VVWFTAGCRVDVTPEAPDATGSIQVNLRADIAPASTLKVANDQWEAGDKVGLYMKPAGQPLSGAYSTVRNVPMSLEGQTLVADPPVNYPENGNVDFIAYHPYTAAVGSDFTVDVDVAGQAGGLPTEVLYSDYVKNQTATSSPVTLNFLYSLAKLEITVKSGEGSPVAEGEFAGMTASIEGMNTQAKLKLADGSFTGKDAKQTITLHKTGSTATSVTFEALVLPTVEADGEITFVFHLNGVTYRETRTVNYASHSLYRLNFAITTSFPEPKATLLNTYIYPRNEYPDQDISVDATSIMTMTTAKEGEVTLQIGGTGKMVIDWGDGTPFEVYSAFGSDWSDSHIYTHSYSTVISRTITIYGENITLFNCGFIYAGYRNNQITSLDVSKNTALTELYCENNQLEILYVSKNTALTTLYCSNNQLEILDLSKNIALTFLYCNYNQLEILDVSKNTALEGFQCYNNKLEILDVSKNTALHNLECGYNPLKILDVSKNTALTSLCCQNNQLEILDVSKNTTLMILSCQNNQLEILDVSKNTALFNLRFHNNQLKI